MNILALDASTEACSAAVLVNGEVVQSQYQVAPRQHTQLLLPQVDQVIADAGLTLTDIDLIAFGRGPGAFTGVRIATATAQGLAQASGKPLKGISTLAALAWLQLKNAEQGKRVVAVLDARMGEVYCCAYERSESGLQALTNEQVCAPEKMPEVEQINSLVGTGQDMQAQFPLAYQTLSFDCVLPCASEIAELAALDPVANSGMPVYLRDNVTD
ncbi:tRNA (adenosine(37)-N6)-threonylcarbamoyltransferase complex dimerization subunit type 1 TsaB [Salinibius halmophilus]|uniref:tRNA (adenosine(37)-N6)-threonylcarbamoyltransferase complex dimerization subunit type 1 TsaB n=1 Tax=Salinibius halmophilus TaxID=1853216 RepID=UPI000E672A0A|nr:tRNA (adenosine(37)-N6)-threonylcarbamoyltransferase complex dimerization subunit type 1 TsaB [Salinibius halmophilus]